MQSMLFSLWREMFSVAHFPLVTSPLSLRRDSFITPDIEDFFSVLMLNFAFLPRKLMVSHSQGFYSLCPAFVVETTKFYWPCEPSGDGADCHSKRSSPVNSTLYIRHISIVCQFCCIIFVHWDTWMRTTSHSLKSIQTVCSYLHTDHLCILKLNLHNNNQWQCTQCMRRQLFVYLHAW